MIILVILPLIALAVVIVIISMLIRLNDKLNRIDYHMSGLRRLTEDVRQQLVKIEEVAMRQAPQAPAVSPEPEVGDVVPEVVEESTSAIYQTVPEESIQMPSLQISDDADNPRISDDAGFIEHPEYSEQPQKVEVVEEKEATSSKQRHNIEKLVGENLFSKIGILALIIGIGFFVKFAIDNDWINQTSRTILGIVIGFGLWGIAYKLRDSYRAFSSVLAGGGFAICFVSIAIAYNFYELIPSWLTFSSLVLLTAVMMLISVKFDRSQLAMVAIIGGYIAPFMSASDNGSAITLLTYTMILNAAMFYVCIKKNWWILSVPGCLITWLIVAISPIKAEQSIVGLVFSTIFLLMFVLPTALAMWRDMKPAALFYALIVAAVVNVFAYVYFALGYIGHISVLNHVRGIVPMIVAGVNALIYLRYYRMQNSRLMQNLLLGAVIVFVLMSVVVQFSDPSIMGLFFAILVLPMLEIYGRTSKRIFVISGIVLSIITFIILNAELCSCSDTPTIGGFTTMLVCGLCYFAYAVIISRSAEVYRNFLMDMYDFAITAACFAAIYLEGCAVSSLMTILHAPEAGLQAAAVMVMTCLLFMSIYFKNNVVNRLTIPGVALAAFVLMNYIPDSRTIMSEIFQWLSACLFICVLVIQARTALGGNQLIGSVSRKKYIAYYSIVGSLFLIAVTEMLLRTASLTEYYSAGFSIALIINGAALLTLGMKYKSITARFIGLGMLGLLLLKLVIYDLWLLPMIGRIIVFILLGVVLLTFSFMYQRLRSKLFDKD